MYGDLVEWLEKEIETCEYVKKVEDFFKDKTQEEIMEIVRRNGGAK